MIEAVVKEFNTKERELGLNDDKLYTTEVKLSLKAIEELYNMFTGKTITKERYFHIIYHLFKHPENHRYETEVTYN